MSADNENDVAEQAGYTEPRDNVSVAWRTPLARGW